MGTRITSQEKLLRLAEFYCSKRETSKAKLSKYLERKCIEQDLEPTVYESWITNVVDACEGSKMVDDARYSEILIRAYTERGKGKRYIESKLAEKGIPKDLRVIPTDEENEFERALKLADKSLKHVQSKVSQKMERTSRRETKKFQPKINESFEIRQKLLAKLVLAGFSLDIAKKAAQKCMESNNGY